MRKTRKVGYWALEYFVRMGSAKSETYFVFMNYDPEYERLRADKSVYLHVCLNFFFLFFVLFFV